jgi:hypothetical protein
MKFPKLFKKATSLKDSSAKFNGNHYKVTIMMMNSDGDPMQLPWKFVRSLTINDNILSPFQSGMMMIDNRLNTLEHYHIPIILPGQTETDRPASFKFNHDGYDLMMIKIKPVFNIPLVPEGISDRFFPPEVWEMSCVFNVYEEDESTAAGTVDRKYKVLYLRDFKEQILSQTNLTWSTADLHKEHEIAVKEITQSSDTLRSVYGGPCIKDIINKTFKDKKFLSETITNKFEDDWEEGGVKTFYSSPANNTAIDDIEYVLDRMISADDLDNCILKYERHHKWSLRSITKYFDRAIKKGSKKPGDFHLDLFTVADQDGPESLISGLLGGKIKGLSRNSFNLKLNFHKFAGISNYSYAGITTKDSVEELISTPVHNYDIRTKKFGMDVEKHHVDKMSKAFQELYADKMHGDKPKLLFPNSDSKKNNEILYNAFSWSPDPTKRFLAGRNKFLNKLFHLNNSLSFEIDGLTYRRSGRFMSVVCTQSVPDVPFQDVFQGEWFITNVVHTFNGSTYKNELTCVKPYAYKKVYEDKAHVSKASLLRGI